MIDVLHLIDTYRIGGPGKTIINSARFIDHRRFRVHVGSFVSRKSEDSEFSLAVRDARIPGFTIPETRRLDFSPSAVIRNYVDEHRIRVVHCHGYRMDVFGFLAVRRLPIAIVTTHHGWIRNNWRQRLFTHVALRIGARFHGIELVSESLRGQLPRSVRSSERVAVVRNGIVLDDYVARGHREEVRANLGVAPNETLLGVIGRLSIEKGCLEVLNAFQAVVSQRPLARLLLLGEGPLLGQVTSRAAAMGIQHRVIFVSHQQSIRRFYEAIDILVSPSRTEGLSNVILEAMAAGKPVVATRVGGNSELIVSGDSGLLVEPMQPGALATSVMRVMDDEALRTLFVRSATARVADEFSFESRMLREERFYEEALERASCAFKVKRSCLGAT